MRLLLVAALALVACGGRPVALTDGAAPCSGPPESWPLTCLQGCQADSDCVLVGPSCCCEAVANKQHRAVAAARMEQCWASKQAEGCGCWLCLPEAACELGSCVTRFRCTKPEADP